MNYTVNFTHPRHGTVTKIVKANSLNQAITKAAEALGNGWRYVPAVCVFH